MLMGAVGELHSGANKQVGPGLELHSVPIVASQAAANASLLATERIWDKQDVTQTCYGRPGSIKSVVRMQLRDGLVASSTVP